MFGWLKRLAGRGKTTTQAHATHGSSRQALQGVRRPTRHQPGRDTSAAFHGDRLNAFMAGQIISIYTSDWVKNAMWSEENETLKLTFNDGHLHTYQCDEGVARAFALAPSKGGFVHDWFIANGVPSWEG